MTGISVSGVGSGLDLQGLLDKLIAAEKAAPTQRLDVDESSTRTRLSALGTIKSALADLQTANDALKAIGAFAARSAVSGNEALFTASADSTALPNTYQIEVQALAAAHKLASGAFASASTVVGTGTLTLAVGAASFNVTIDGSNDTLAGIRDAINAAPGNTGVRASIIVANDGAHLVLASTQTGTAHALTVSQTGSLGGLTGTLAQTQAAADAVIVVDGFTHTSDSNTIAGAIGGVTLTLKSASVGQPATLTVGNDTAAVKKAVQDFVAAYNKVVGAVANATRYNPTTKVAAPLAGDVLPRAVASQLRALLGNTVAGIASGPDMLAQIGVTSSKDGTLTVDAAKLDTALASNYSNVQQLFTSTNGYATKLDGILAGFLDGGGLIKTREDALNERLTRIGDQRDELQRHLDAMQRRLQAQFTALDTLVAQMKSTGDYLTQQLAGLNKGNG